MFDLFLLFQKFLMDKVKKDEELPAPTRHEDRCRDSAITSRKGTVLVNYLRSGMAKALRKDSRRSGTIR